ncbi:MAG: S1 RNA-binding domain-containing protein [Oscillospiraceae bacterium]
MSENVFEGALADSEENKRRLSSLSTLREACEHKNVLEQYAGAFDRSRSLIFRLGDIKGIMPFCECAAGIEDPRVRDISIISRVGRAVCFIITGFEEREGNTVALLSRREVQSEYSRSTLSLIMPGDVIRCRVTHLAPFGAFVDVGRGIAALLPVDAISVSRIPHPNERLCIGDELRCAVRSVDERGRLSLSLKELLGSWTENATLFEPGETRGGIIRSVENYGVFVELTPNLAGLAEPFPEARAGNFASVYIKSIIPEKMKIKLAIVDLPEPASRPREPLRYFFEGNHLDRFCYSPPESLRVVETVFE